jgi:hypothetical protein
VPGAGVARAAKEPAAKEPAAKAAEAAKAAQVAAEVVSSSAISLRDPWAAQAGVARGAMERVQVAAEAAKELAEGVAEAVGLPGASPDRPWSSRALPSTSDQWS